MCLVKEPSELVRPLGRITGLFLFFLEILLNVVISNLLWHFSENFFDNVASVPLASSSTYVHTQIDLLCALYVLHYLRMQETFCIDGSCFCT